MKKTVVLTIAAIFFLSAGVATAAKVKCTVDAVDGEKITLTCKKADKLKAGDKVSLKVKSDKKGAVEGC
ncbi:MAG: hypothetical protein CSA34_00485 [Desulfobulbus propionicus]|nr:MAG: hypothetical protein CSA34_00485 [Desulfobulbus propionicus]